MMSSNGGGGEGDGLWLLLYSVVPCGGIALDACTGTINHDDGKLK